MLKIENISKRFGGLKALDDCSIQINKGSLVAIIGPNGSGKTTLFNVISRLLKEDSGKIFLQDKELTKMEDFKVALEGISRTFQEPRLFRNLNIKEHLQVVITERNDRLLSSIFNRGADYTEKIVETLNLIGLKKDLSISAIDLSYGQKKLLDLAMAVIRDHDILMLDEPVAGVNPALREQIKKVLKKLNKTGETILIIEHDMNFVMDLADYIYVLDNGRVIARGKPSEIKNNKKVLEAYLVGE